MWQKIKKTKTNWRRKRQTVLDGAQKGKSVEEEDIKGTMEKGQWVRVSQGSL